MANVFIQFLVDVENGDLDGVKRNIVNGINLETRDEDQQTALILAARCNYVECVKALLEANADVNAEDVDNWTALLNGCHNGNLEIVRALLERDALIEHYDCGHFTPLMWASYQGHTRIVEYLLTCGANVDAVDEHGITSLSWASGRNYVNIVTLLLAAGASPNLCDKNNTTALIWASRRGHTKVVELLLKYNASVNNIGMKNMTALLAATKGGYSETALCLLDNRTIDIKIQDKDGQTPLSHACAQGMTDVVAELIRRHAYVNTVDKNGDPVLFSAVKGGQEDCVAILLDSHADIDAIGADNKTALWWAVERGRVNVVKHLLQYNPDVEVSGGPDDDTPLVLATKRKRVGIVYELIKYGARLSSVDRFGDNSLHIALRNRSRDIADILLSNPRHAKYLYRPNKHGETPYKIDASLQKSILTTIFGQRTLNLNDDSILGYDLYSSALAEILSEPSLRTPITVGLYAKWGSGKSALLTHLKDEMHSFAQLTDFPIIKFSPLLLSVIIIIALIVGLITGFLIHFIVGISLGVALILFPLVLLFMIQYLLRHKDYLWTANIAQFINKRLEILRFLLQVLFMNPYARRGLKINDTIDCRKMKFIFTEYGKVSTADGEKASAGMIAELAVSVEETFGLVATRLCRALHSKDTSHHRFRHICCVPAFIIVIIQISLILTLSILTLVNGVPSNHRSINTIYIVLTSILSTSIALSFGTWFRLIKGLMRSPRSKIIKFSDRSSRLNETSLYRLRKEVSQLSYIIKTVEAFLNINTRLVVLIDGLDVCEQQRILQILDQVHVLLTKENDPFITLIVCDPHKMMQDMTTTVTTTASSPPPPQPTTISSLTQRSGFDTTVNGHDYLLSIIQLPIYLQLNLNRTKLLKKESDTFPKRRRGTLTTGTSVLDVSAQPPTTAQKLSKNKRRRQRRDTLPNTKPVTTSELTHQLLQSDYFLDINPRILQRLINIIAMTGRLLRANQALFSWKRLGCWSYLVEQWPYRITWIIVYYEDHEQDYGEDTELKTLYNKLKPFIPISNDPLLELDRNGRKFELCIERSEPILNVTDLKQFLPCTCNLDPYLNKIIRESASYFYMKNSDHNGFMNGDPSRFFPRHDPTYDGHNGYYQPGPYSRHKNNFYPKFNFGNVYRPYTHIPMTKQENDDDMRLRTSSVASSTMPIIQPLIEHQQQQQQQPLSNNPSANVKIDLLPSLSEMTVNDICDCLKTDITGLKPTMIPIYIQDLNENNISGRVLATCQLDELKQILSMAFGDWILFSNWIRAKREEELRSQFHQQTLSTSKSKINDHQNLSNNDTYNDYQFYRGNDILNAALDQLLHTSSQHTTINSADEIGMTSNDKVSIVSGPKNVKFLIPLTRSGITSNESTFGVIESTTRTITHVKDLFPVNLTLQSQTTQINNDIESSTPSSSSHLTTIASLFSIEPQQTVSHNDSEEIPLLPLDNSNDN
ncbi:unnamed protein product [Adineta steineri]|uniref:KAP NTPase domain-containing protein n=1 Tax=Adineta steineri TaxID=433720 RepID=A0A818HVB0_9BILA|nr:unnamed protein product [Adineta steineri]CAF3511860.1 unnamed protein product [Adineta steineri]